MLALPRHVSPGSLFQGNPYIGRCNVPRSLEMSRAEQFGKIQPARLPTTHQIQCSASWSRLTKSLAAPAQLPQFHRFTLEEPPSLTSPYLTSRHVTSLHFTSLHVTSRHATSLHFTSLHFTSLHFTSLHLTSPHLTSPHLTSLHFTSLHFTSLTVAALAPPNSKNIDGETESES